MAPPMKELPRWLLENPEFSVAPDWTDIVKQSVSKKLKTTQLHPLLFFAEVETKTLLLTGFPSRGHV